MTPVRPFVRRMRLAACAAVASSGCFAMTLWLPRWMLVVALAAIGMGLAALGFFLLRDAPMGSVFRRKQKQFALAFGVFATGFTGVVAFTALINSMETRRRFNGPLRSITGDRMSASSQDEEIGWAPHAPRTHVGQRLNRIDHSRRHIVFVGDSVTLGHGVGEADTFVHRVGERFPSYQALNLSVSGWSPDQEYLYLRNHLRDLNPRVIVMGLFAGNDFQFTGREWNYGSSKPIFDVQGGRLVRVNRAENCLNTLSRSLLFQGVWRMRDVAINTVRAICNPTEFPSPRIEPVLRALFAATDRLGAERGVPVLWVLLPVSEDWGPNSSPERVDYTGKYDALRRLLEEGGHNYFEPYLDLARAHAPVRDLYLDPGHYTPRGHQIVADAITRELVARFGVER